MSKANNFNAVFLRRDESFSRKIDEKVSSVESRKDEKCEDNIKDQHDDKKVVNEKRSTILIDSLPPKLHDLGSFTIPCMVNDIYFYKVLCDLGASVNLMPYSLYEKLGLKKLKPSPISLLMADRTARLPKDVVEDVLVKVGELVFPVDFVVMDMKEDHKIPIIFGRPFLAASQALIDVPKGQVTIRA
ncbi:uncharacterized protein LOC110724378 [Chenopodium quinoa]|uniref:uncharacterized protein LOC110724378 n=1 Tax=Chenopodium quinoa TaxID=63459 RepID=UPI000B797897|nr:uncharacterized protein LOC110724378 [Chenopodium quinoa]